MSVVTRDDAIYLIENGMRNWPRIPRISEDDLEDLRASLEGIVRRHRQSAIAELCEGLREAREAGQALYDAVGAWEKPESGWFTPAVLQGGSRWVAALAKLDALLSKHSPDAPGDERHV